MRVSFCWFLFGVLGSWGKMRNGQDNVSLSWCHALWTKKSLHGLSRKFHFAQDTQVGYPALPACALQLPQPLRSKDGRADCFPFPLGRLLTDAFLSVPGGSLDGSVLWAGWCKAHLVPNKREPPISSEYLIKLNFWLIFDFLNSQRRKFWGFNLRFYFYKYRWLLA